MWLDKTFPAFWIFSPLKTVFSGSVSSLRLYIRKFINIFFTKHRFYGKSHPRAQSCQTLRWINLSEFSPDCSGAGLCINLIHTTQFTQIYQQWKILGCFYFLCMGDNLQCEIANFSFKFALLHSFKYHKLLPLIYEAATVVPVIIIILLWLPFFSLLHLERTIFCWTFRVWYSKKLMWMGFLVLHLFLWDI